MLFIFFFFKQKTAYEMRISDWRSDVCSSDLSKRLTIDFRKQTMEVSDSGERVAIDSDAIIVRARRRSGQLILVDSQANGEKINVILNTGSDRSIGNLALLRTLTHKRKIEAL